MGESMTASAQRLGIGMLARRLNKVTPRWPVSRADVPVTACCVYRAGNAHHVERMSRQLPANTDIRLHALDVVARPLARHTLGVGPGERMPLLQMLLDARDIATGSWVVLFDDDTDFVCPGRSPFLDIASAAGFDIAGAAIEPGHAHSHSHTLVARCSVARTVGMVEIGPVVALSPHAFAAVTPFEPDSGMGWGYDVRWSQLRQLRQGYVDASPIRHHGVVGIAYDTTGERVRMAHELASAGLESTREIAVTVDTWPSWRRRPPWL
jgi:hypothetical protein